MLRVRHTGDTLFKIKALLNILVCFHDLSLADWATPLKLKRCMGEGP